MKNFLLALISGCLLLASTPATAQSLDAFVGINALTASQALQNIPRLGGGLFPSAGVTIMLLGGFGVNGEVAFRGSQENYEGTGLRPIYYDINGVWAPVHITRSVVPELLLGIGSQSLRAYEGITQCGTVAGCTTYASSNHLTGHVGLLVKLYLTEHIFLQPEAHFYFIRNNTEFDTSNAERFGVSLGYTLGGS